MLKKQSGITLVALIIIIIVMIILASVSLYSGGKSVRTARSNNLKSELEMVQHAVLERYTNYKVSQNDYVLVGDELSYDDANKVADQMGVKLSDQGTYYELKQSDLANLGITETDDTYIVNYETGEVLNKTQMKTKDNDVLYRSQNSE